nr:periplasmic nitrate reductase, NapE protein [Stutzerimonas stutzeri]
MGTLTRLPLRHSDLKVNAVPHHTDPASAGKPEETRLFVFLLVFLFPLLSVLTVSGYGFIVWISQLFFGPPGPPS